MEPVRYVDLLNRRYKAQGFPPYRWTVNTSAPFTPLRKPLRDCRVSMLTSGGVSRCASAPWNPDAHLLQPDDLAAVLRLSAVFELGLQYVRPRHREADEHHQRVPLFSTL